MEEIDNQEEKPKDEQINDEDNIDNLAIEKEKENEEIEQIDNIENLKKNLFMKNDSFSSEDSNELLNIIFGKYPLGIQSLITENKPREDDVYLVLIFNGTEDFIKKYIFSAKRKPSYISENDDDELNPIELKEDYDDALENKNLKKTQVNNFKNNEKKKFLNYFEQKVKNTQKYIKLIKNVFKELNKTSDKLIEKIINYYGQRISEKIQAENMEYYNICLEEVKNYEEDNNGKIDKSLLNYYYELSFEDFILIFSCLVHYYTGLEVKLELREKNSNDVCLLLFCDEEIYEKLADFFGYELQLKPYALNYKESSGLKVSKKSEKKLTYSSKNIDYSKTININEVSDLKLPSLVYEYQYNENKFMFSPPYRKFDLNKESKFRRYLPNDGFHICKNDPDFSRDFETKECHRNCSKFRSIDKFRLIHESLNYIMTISHLYKSGLLKMIINKRNNISYQELSICSLFFNLIKFGYSDYLKTINIIRNFFGESVAFYFLWAFYYSLWSLPPVLIGVFLYFIPILKKQPQATVKKIVKFLDNYELPSIIFGLLILVCTWLFLKSWEQKERIFQYLWGVEIKEYTHFTSEYFIPDNTEQFILGETLLVSSYYTRLKKTISIFIVLTLILIRIYIDYLIYNPNLLKEETITNFIKKFQIWMPLIIKPISIFNNFICNKLSIWENNETKSRQQNSFAWKLILLEFFNYYTTLARVAIVNNKDYQLQMKRTIYIFLALDLTTYILKFCFELLRYLYKNGTLSTHKMDINKKISSTLEHQLNSSEKKNIIFEMNKKMIRFGYLCIFSSQAPLTPIIIFIVNLIETFIDLYKFFFLYRVEIIEKARGIGVYTSIIKTLFFVCMLVNVGLVFFHQDEKENFVTIIFIIVVFENVLFFINLLSINSFLPFWFLNLSEIKSLYDKKYYSRDSTISRRLSMEKEEEI